MEKDVEDIVKFLYLLVEHFQEQRKFILKEVERETMRSNFYAGAEYGLSFAADQIESGCHLKKEGKDG